MDMLLFIVGGLIIVWFSIKGVFFNTVQVYDIEETEYENEYHCKFKWRGKERNGVFISDTFKIRENKKVLLNIDSYICDDARWIMVLCNN